VAGPVAKLKSSWTAAANSILPRVRGAPENIAQGAARRHICHVFQLLLIDFDQ